MLEILIVSCSFVGLVLILSPNKTSSRRTSAKHLEGPPGHHPIIRGIK